MKNSIFIKLIILLIAIFVLSGTDSSAQLFFDAETGIVRTGYNNVRIPGNSGTPFSLQTDLDAETGFFYRFRAGYIINERHTLSLLFAPLELKSSGKPGFNILFQDQTFSAGTDLIGTYVFNSYRLTYRYDLLRREKLTFGIGFTAKIRDAKISLESGSAYAEKTNIGFVPIINFRLDWREGEKLGLIFEGDALAAPQGRAEDILLSATYKLSNQLRFRVGYRILEGGADNDEVYNFTLINYAVIGITWTLID